MCCAAYSKLRFLESFMAEYPFSGFICNTRNTYDSIRACYRSRCLW